MKYGLLFFLAFFWCGFLTAQDVHEKKRVARELFAHQRYEEALALLNSSRQLNRDDKEARFLIALCHYQLNDLEASFRILRQIIEQERSPYPECWLFIGKIYHARHEFKKAIDYYKEYLGLLDPGAENRQLIWNDIRRCALGMELQYRQAGVFVENLGPQVNTRYDEFAPVLSPNVNEKLYFSAARKESIGGRRSEYGAPDARLGRYFTDVFSCELREGVWSDVRALHYLLNSPQHEVLLDFNSDGSVLYYYKGLRPDQGDILVDTFRQAEDRVISSTPLPGPVNARAGDRDLFFYNDTLLLFASRRPGGYGGYDIYRSFLRRGRWTTPENMGPNINTPYDEITPFLSRNGRMLYFSTNHSERSIGGFDVLKSLYNYKTDIWMAPENLALPVNSAGDDTHFRLARDGFTAFFASSRKDGYGQRDLYVAYFSDFLEEQEAPLTFRPPSGLPAQLPPDTEGAPRTVTADAPRSAPEAGIAPLSLEGKAPALNDAQRRDLDRLAGVLLADRAQQLVLTGYCRRQRPVSECFAAAMGAAETAAGYLQEAGVSEEQLFLRAFGEGHNERQGPEVVVTFHFAGEEEGLPLLQSPEDAIPGFPQDLPTDQPLFYKVQMAASRRMDFFSPEMAPFDHLMVEKSADSDYYRYTVGAVSSFAEAEQLRKRAADRGSRSAFVVPYVHRGRLPWEQVSRYLSSHPDLSHYLAHRGRN